MSKNNAQKSGMPGWKVAIPGLWAMFVVGVASAMIGPILPALAQVFGLDWGEAGRIFSAQFGGKLAAVLLLSLRAWRISSRTVAMAGGLLLGAGLLLTSYGSSWLIVLAAIILFGLGHGGVDAGFNAMFAEAYGRGPDGAKNAGRWLNQLHLLFGIGALSAPAFVTYLLYRSTWRSTFLIAGVFGLMVPVILLVMRRILQEQTERPVQLESDVSQGRFGLGAGVALAIAVCFLYGGLETALGGWIFTFLTEGAFATGPIAAFSVTAFWALLTTGRFLSVWGVEKIGPLRWILVLSVVLVGSLAAGLVLTRFGTAAAVVAIAGLGLSGIFPTLIAWATGGRNRPPAQTVAWLIAASSLGAISIPWLVGVAADWQGINASFFGLLLLAIGLSLLVAWMMRIERRGCAPLTPAEGHATIQ